MVAPDRGHVRDPDLGTAQMPAISWDRGREALRELYDWAELFAREAIAWYLSEKKRKANWSRSLRALSVILATAGGAIPVAALAAGRPVVGNWGFVLLALAAGCLAYDRFFGYSSAWLRYMSAAISLRSQLSDFQLEWVKEMAALGSREPTAEEVMLLVDLVRSFAHEVNETIRDETRSWLVEFSTNLSELESRLRQSPSSEAVSGITTMAADKGDSASRRDQRPGGLRSNS